LKTLIKLLGGISTNYKLSFFKIRDKVNKKGEFCQRNVEKSSLRKKSHHPNPSYEQKTAFAPYGEKAVFIFFV
jgi:hypothetical protein